MSEKKKFLVVDDSEIIRNTMRNFFRGANIEIFFSVNGLDGIQKTALYKPDLIILDLLMPDLDGLKMLKVIKLLEGMNKIPVIVISANMEKHNVLAAIKAGANKVITKPLQMDVLFKAVNDLFGFKLLRNPRENEFFTEIEKLELKKELLKTFMTAFQEKEKLINEYIKEKNINELILIIHEIKGTGSSVGYPKITEMSTEIEYKLQFSDTDWSFISLKCEQLINYINCLNK